MPVLAGNVVCSSQPLASSAGLRMLACGGNAIDAALAAANALTVVEPCMNGIGGDRFAMVWDGQQLHGLNGSGRAPRRWTREHFLRYAKMPTHCWDTVTVPGAVSGWRALSQRFGAFAFADLFDPAIRYARDGLFCVADGQPPVGRTIAYGSRRCRLHRHVWARRASAAAG